MTFLTGGDDAFPTRCRCFSYWVPMLFLLSDDEWYVVCN